MKQSQALTMQETYWSLTTEQLLAALHTANNGLQQTDAESRIKRYGPNALKAQRQATAFGLLLRRAQVFERGDGEREQRAHLITKGALENILKISTHVMTLVIAEYPAFD